LGNYLLRITLAATRATGKQKMMIKCTNFAGHFDGNGNMPVITVALPVGGDSGLHAYTGFMYYFSLSTR
jgi:hypothetical protein